jgi:hypothetical protein
MNGAIDCDAQSQAWGETGSGGGPSAFEGATNRVSWHLRQTHRSGPRRQGCQSLENIVAIAKKRGIEVLESSTRSGREDNATVMKGLRPIGAARRFWTSSHISRACQREQL